MLGFIWRAMAMGAGIARRAIRYLLRSLLQSAAAYLEQMRGKSTTPTSLGSFLTIFKILQNLRQLSELNSDPNISEASIAAPDPFPPLFLGVVAVLQGLRTSNDLVL